VNRARWSLAGEFVENCNCDVLCPCITSADEGPGDYDRCLVPMICHIERGVTGELRLDGLNFAYVIDSPAIMASGDWRLGLYIDADADAAQALALERILTGRLGGPPEAIMALVGEYLGVKRAAIAFEARGRTRRAVASGLFEIEVEGLSVPGSERVYEITNVLHPMGDTLPIARARVGVVNDPDFRMCFDNSGKNAHYRSFDWRG
jgi:hypothetical protein